MLPAALLSPLFLPAALLLRGAVACMTGGKLLLVLLLLLVLILL